MYQINIEKIRPIQPDEFFIIRIPLDKQGNFLISVEDAHEISKYLLKKFPKNKGIIIPEGIELSYVEWEVLNNYIQSIKPKGEIE